MNYDCGGTFSTDDALGFLDDLDSLMDPDGLGDAPGLLADAASDLAANQYAQEMGTPAPGTQTPASSGGFWDNLLSRAESALATTRGTAPAAPASSGGDSGGFFGWFGNLFGGDSSTAGSPKSPAKPAPPASSGGGSWLDSLASVFSGSSSGFTPGTAKTGYRPSVDVNLPEWVKPAAIAGGVLLLVMVIRK